LIVILSEAKDLLFAHGATDLLRKNRSLAEGTPLGMTIH